MSPLELPELVHCENTDLFAYVGCHYVDQVQFITGLKPVEVSVYGIVDEYPNGNEGYLWTDARVVWENEACLSVLNAIGYPDAGPGGNSQGLRLFNKGEGDGCIIFHDDQYRGLKYCLIRPGTGRASRPAWPRATSSPAPTTSSSSTAAGPGWSRRATATARSRRWCARPRAWPRRAACPSPGGAGRDRRCRDPGHAGQQRLQRSWSSRRGVCRSPTARGRW